MVWLVWARIGVTDVMTGCAGALMVKLNEFEGPPPGDGLVTITAQDPGVAWSVALSEMVNWVEPTKVAVWPTPL
jgi:hypothetical protein